MTATEEPETALAVAAEKEEKVKVVEKTLSKKVCSQALS